MELVAGGWRRVSIAGGGGECQRKRRAVSIKKIILFFGVTRLYGDRIE